MSLLKSIAYSCKEFIQIDQFEAKDLETKTASKSLDELESILKKIAHISGFTDLSALTLITQSLIELSQNSNPAISSKAKDLLYKYSRLKQIKGRISDILLIINSNQMNTKLNESQIGHVFAINNMEINNTKISTEGMPYSAAINYLLTVLAEYKKFLLSKTISNPLLSEKNRALSEKIEKMEKQLELCKNYYFFYERAANNEGVKHDLFQKLEQNIKELKNGESLIIPGGWTTKKVKHAILYELKKIGINDDGETVCEWRIFNTGFGLAQNHKQNGKEQKFQTVKEIINIPQNELNYKFFEKLLNLRLDANGDKGKKCDELYNLMDNLTKKGAKYKNHEEISQRKQKGGFCTWKSLKAWLKFHLTKEEYKDLKQFIDTYSFLSYENILANNLSNNNNLKVLQPYVRDKFQKRLLKSL